MTWPRWWIGSAITSRKRSTSAGATSTTNRLADSENSAVGEVVVRQRRDIGAEPAADAHLGERDRQAALAHVVARPARDRRGSPDGALR